MLKYRVVLVTFPFDDLRASKVRPALCLSEPLGAYEHVVVAFISSRIPRETLETDLLVDSERPGFAATGLKVTSTIRVHRLMTISASAIVRELGRIPDNMIGEIRSALSKLFDLD